MYNLGVGKDKTPAKNAGYQNDDGKRAHVSPRVSLRTAEEKRKPATTSEEWGPIGCGTRWRYTTNQNGVRDHQSRQQEIESTHVNPICSSRIKIYRVRSEKAGLHESISCRRAPVRSTRRGGKKNEALSGENEARHRKPVGWGSVEKTERGTLGGGGNQIDYGVGGGKLWSKG